VEETNKKHVQLESTMTQQIEQAAQAIPASLPIVQKSATKASLILSVAQKPEVLSQLSQPAADAIQIAAQNIQQKLLLERKLMDDKVQFVKLVEEQIPQESPERIELQNTRQHLQNAMIASHHISHGRNELLQHVYKSALSETGQRLIQSKAATNYGRRGEQTTVQDHKIESNNSSLYYLKQHPKVHFCGKIDGFRNNELIEIKHRLNRLNGEPYFIEKIQLWIYMEMLKLRQCRLIERHGQEEATCMVDANPGWIVRTLYPWADEFAEEYFDMLGKVERQDELLEVAASQGAVFDVQVPSGLVVEVRNNKGVGNNNNSRLQQQQQQQPPHPVVVE
jgi:hypothetical protein